MNILLIEPDQSLADIYKHMMPKDETVFHVRNAQDAIDILDSNDVALVVTDMYLDAEHNGVEVLHELRSYEDWLEVPIIVISDIPQDRLAHVPWQRYGVVSFVRKHTLTPQSMGRLIRSAVGQA